MNERDRDLSYWQLEVVRAVADAPQLAPHLFAVGARAGALAGALDYSPEERALCTAAGLVHDVAKSPSLVISGFHPLDAAKWAAERGGEMLTRLVAHHTGAAIEARMLGIEIPFSAPEPHLAEVLLLADLTTTQAGLSVTLTERRTDIEARYADDSVPVRSLREFWPDVQRLAPWLDLLGERAE